MNESKALYIRNEKMNEIAKALYIRSEEWLGHKRDSKDFDDLPDMTWAYWFELARTALDCINKSNSNDG